MKECMLAAAWGWGVTLSSGIEGIGSLDLLSWGMAALICAIGEMDFG